MLSQIVGITAILFFLYFVSYSIAFVYRRLKKTRTRLSSAFAAVVVAVLMLILITPTPPSHLKRWKEKEECLDKACLYLKVYGCSVSALDELVKSVDVDGDGKDDSIREVCRFADIGNDMDCLKACSCL